MTNPAFEPVARKMATFTATEKTVRTSVNASVLSAGTISRRMATELFIGCLRASRRGICLAVLGNLPEEVKQSTERDRHPVGPVVQLIAQFVQHFLEHRQLE